MAKRLMTEREIMMRQLEHLKNGGKLEDVFGKPGTVVQNAPQESETSLPNSNEGI